MMNLSKLEKEGKKWVEDGIITEEQLTLISNRYTKQDANVLVILFAILLTSLALLTFIFSDWAQVAHLSRVIIILGFTISLYILGDQLYNKKHILYGISFIILGYIGFAASLFLVINNYEVVLYNSWPFVLLSLTGLGLYFIYNHLLLFYLSIVILTFGQLFSEFSYTTYSYALLAILIIGFGYFTIRHANKLVAYLFGISLVINLVSLALSFEGNYYWFIVYMFAFYLVAHFIPNEVLSKPFKLLSLGSMFIYNMFQATWLQDGYYQDEIKLSGLFLVILLILVAFMIIIKRVTFKTIDYVYLLLFIPTIYLPYASLITILILFTLSAALLIIGYKHERHQLITYGTVAFLLSTLTVYIEFAWNVMNKSLFFLIGGLILFSFSLLLERNRRQVKEKKEVE